MPPLSNSPRPSPFPFPLPTFTCPSSPPQVRLPRHTTSRLVRYCQRAVNLDRALFQGTEGTGSLYSLPTPNSPFLHHPHKPLFPFPPLSLPLQLPYRQRAVNLDRALFQAHRGHKLMRDVRPAATRFHHATYTFNAPSLFPAPLPAARTPSRLLDQGAVPFLLLVIKASRPFLCYVLWEPASWPHRILMYMVDVIDSDEHYFSTVACHSPRFNHSLLNASLHFATFAKGSPHSLEMNDSFNDAFTSGVFLFARKFPRDSPTLDRID
ncbi:unnamed protein product, partial [Closterium sp. Naga37s-1]